MVEYLELFKGDDTDFSLNQAICIKLVTDYDLAGCTAHVKFYDYEQTFYPIVDKKLPLSFPGSVTSKFPLGRGSAKIWLTETDPEGSGTRRRTVANDLKILVTNNIDLLSRKDISYTMLLRYDYKDLDSKPMLNGKVIDGDHTDDYYGIKGPKPDTELSEKSENAVQNKAIALKFKATDKTISNHVNQKSGNPHNVGKSDVGLGNVDNTSDTDKPVSTAQAKAIKAVDDAVKDEVKTARENEKTLAAGLTDALKDLNAEETRARKAEKILEEFKADSEIVNDSKVVEHGIFERSGDEISDLTVLEDDGEVIAGPNEYHFAFNSDKTATVKAISGKTPSELGLDLHLVNVHYPDGSPHEDIFADAMDEAVAIYNGALIELFDGESDTREYAYLTDREIEIERLLTIPESIELHTEDCVRKGDDVSITVDDVTGNWTLDKDYPQPEMSATPYFEYVADKRPGKSGYVWRMTSAYDGTNHLWYGPTDANAIVGDFDTGIDGIPTYTASRIKRIEARATQSSLVSPNEKRLATMAAVRKVIQSTLADVEKKKDKTDLWIYEVENENWVFSGGPEEFLAIANEIGADKPYYSSGKWMLPNYGKYTFETAGKFETDRNATVLRSYTYNNPDGPQFEVTVRRTSAVSTEPVHIEKINAMATRIAKNMIKFAIKDLNPTTSTVNELITALQTIYA